MQPAVKMNVKIYKTPWKTITRRHGFGTWSMGMCRKMHDLELNYLYYFGSAVVDSYIPIFKLKWIWNGFSTAFHISGLIFYPQPIPPTLFKRNK